MEHRFFIVIDGNHRIFLLREGGELAHLGVKTLKLNVNLLDFKSTEVAKIIDFSLHTNLTGEARVLSSFADKASHTRNLIDIWVREKWIPYVNKSSFTPKMKAKKLAEPNMSAFAEYIGMNAVRTRQV